MTNDDKALVERLRKGVVIEDDGRGTTITRTSIVELHAADRIEALSAENERLREALENIVNNCGQCGGYGTYPEEETVTGKVLWWDCSSPQCQSARAALGEQQ